MDDDIDVIPHGNSGYHDDANNSRDDNLSNMHISFTRDDKDGSLHALSTAYKDMKKRYQELESKNNAMSQRIRELERVSPGRPLSFNFGGAAGPACGADAQGAEMEAQAKAEYGYAQNLERQVLRARITIKKLEEEKMNLQQKICELQRSISLSQGKDEIILQLKESLRARGHSSSNLELRKEIEDLRETNEKLGKENEDLKLFNESLQNRCIALEKQESGARSDLSMSLSVNDEKFIMDQMEGYRSMVKDLKLQVSKQGEMLCRQKEAIKKLIAEVQAYRSKQSSMSFRNPDGASFHEVKDSYLADYKGSPQNITMETAGHNFHTLNPLTIEQSGRHVNHAIRGSLDSASSRYQSKKGWPSRTSESNDDLYVGMQSGRKLSPDRSSAIVRSKVATENNYPYSTGARSKVLVHPSSNSGFIVNFYENVGDVDEKQSEVQKTDMKKKVENSSYSNLRLGSSTIPDNDYVNIEEIPPHPNPGFAHSPKPSAGLVQSPLPTPGSVQFEPVPQLTGNERRLLRQPVSSENRLPAPDKNGALCPVCRQEFPNLSMEAFQMHVISCMDHEDEGDLTIMQNPTAGTGNDNRICPMCDASFPSELPQSEFERHVQEHFGEDPIVDRFEVLQP